MSQRHWSCTSSDPNGSEALARRGEQLAQAWRPTSLASGDRRIETLASYAAGRKSLDIGCVDHSADKVSLSSPRWLHARLVHEASAVVGVDTDRAGIDKMTNELGLEAICHDITRGAGPLGDWAPFEVIVAGEVIEHLRDPSSMLVTANQLLVTDGVLVISTPNPYAPWRVRQGQLRHVYENVDHVAYLFPSGMAELAARSGLVLEEAYSVMYPTLKDSLGYGVDALRRRMRGMRGREPHVWPLGLDLPDVYVPPWQWLMLSTRRRLAWLGEHAIYVLRKP